MNTIFLKRLFLTSAVALYTQSLSGMENINDQANINRPQAYGQPYQQRPNLYAPPPNTLPWMDIIPQNQVISLAPQYVNTPMGAHVIHQTMNLTVYPVAQYNPMPRVQNHPAQMPMAVFPQNNFPVPQQANMQVMPQQNQNGLPEIQYNNITASEEPGGMKRRLEPYTKGYNPGPGLWNPSVQQTLNQTNQPQANESEESESEEPGSEDPGYKKLVQFEEDISRAITILCLPKALKEIYGFYIPHDIIHSVMKDCCRLNYHLDLYDSRIQDENFLKFKFHEMITSLTLCDNYTSTNKALVPLTNLTSLNLSENHTITDKGLVPLTNLTSLNLSENHTITDKGLVPLTNLTSLDLYWNRMITNEALVPLTNLTSLELRENKIITNEALVALTNLTSLGLSSNGTITNEALVLLTKLTSLDLSSNDTIRNEALVLLTNLTTLGLRYNYNITNDALVLLTKLTSLDLSSNGTITDIGLAPLTNLASLMLYSNYTITNEMLNMLPKLKVQN